MGVRIYRPTKNAMQSGKAHINEWVLEYEPEDTRYIEPLMGWTGNADTRQQLRLRFESVEEAIAYAKKKKLEYTVIEPKKSKLKLQSYAANFSK